MNVDVLHDELRRRAFLHDDPEAYLAGVDDALETLTSDLVVDQDAKEERGA